VVNGKDYHWCPNHQAFGRHEPAQCQGKGIKSLQTTIENPSNPQDQTEENQPKQLKLSNALSALVEQSQQEDDEEFP
jgi:hypothetical protein